MRDLFGTAPAPEKKRTAPVNEGGRDMPDDPNKDTPTKAHILTLKQIERRVIAETELEDLLPWLQKG